jgi:hypothetical protein
MSDKDNRPRVYSDNPDIVPAKIWFKKGFFGGGTWYVKWSMRGQSLYSTADMSLTGGSRGGNMAFNGVQFNYSVEWSV